MVGLTVSIANLPALSVSCHLVCMTEASSFLVESLRRVIAGGDVTNDQLDAAIANPAALRGAERNAWHGLSYWADDDDIRAKDSEYAPSRRRQLASRLIDLEREGGR